MPATQTHAEHRTDIDELDSAQSAGWLWEYAYGRCGLIFSGPARSLDNAINVSPHPSTCDWRISGGLG